AAGRVQVVDLALAAELAAQGRAPTATRLEDLDVRRVWPVPDAPAHKYTRGVVGVVAGSVPYPGAAVLTVAGATATGCGMVRYVGPAHVREQVVAAHPEVVAGGSTQVRVQAWVVGPGVQDEDQSARVREVLQAAAAQDVPVVVDAGALDDVPDRVPATVVLTPHAGELARFLSARGVPVERSQVEAEPVRWAREAHVRSGATVLLKGAVTLVVGAGDESCAPVLAQGPAPAWLATAGAGDVLAGVLGALLAGVGARSDQPWSPGVIMRAVAAGVHVHGLAAAHANPGGPVTSPAVAHALPGVVARLLRPTGPRGRES
ncbi:ADP-dependent NAD(P)H-hydrate dehydratase, partial [Cellulomonas bogoriensis]|uniref:ADP-dependent NAD(P)H-hydrate dehydratase n=1 Tax=Cellulomonas bogoriensis TaxID=301388 RepID=UPI0005520306